MAQDRPGSFPLVVFTSRPNSHPFHERHITIQEPVKIGRSVARAHPAPANAIFDCKVLSRNHALLWFEDNKFYLQDTKSSNGTFVNNQRLSKGSEESEPHEIFSGDIIQFGVDVMENSKRVTHGCIMASITLYLPDGSEARPRFSGRTPTTSHSLGSIHSQELYQLSQYIQEALHREQVLQDKMSQMQRILNVTNEACETSWHALINEDRLLSKLEVLQNQLSVFSKSVTEGSLQQQIISLEEERLNRENSAKQSLRKVLEEKILAIQDLNDTKRSLTNTQEECKHLTMLREENQQQISELSEKYEVKLLELNDLSQRLKDVESNHDDEIRQCLKDKEDLQTRLEELYSDRDSLQAKVTYLQSSYSPSQQNPGSAGSSSSLILDVNGDHLVEQTREGGDSEPQKWLPNSVESQLEEAQIRITEYLVKLSETENLLEAKEAEIKMLNQQLDNTQLNMVEYVTKVATLEELVKASDAPHSSLDSHDGQADTADLSKLVKSYEETIGRLQEELETLRNSSTEGDNVEVSDKLAIAQSNSAELSRQLQQINDQLTCEKRINTENQLQVNSLNEELKKAKHEIETQQNITQEFKAKTVLLEDKVNEISSKHKSDLDHFEAGNNKLKKDLENRTKEYETLKNECNSLRTKVQNLESELKKLKLDNSQLDGETVKAKQHNKELSAELARLEQSCKELRLIKDSLEIEQVSLKESLADSRKEQNTHRTQLDLIQTDREGLLCKYNSTVEELTHTKERMEETLRVHSQTQHQLETVKGQLASANEELRKLSEKTNDTSFSYLPVMVLVLAVVLAIYPLIKFTCHGS